MNKFVMYMVRQAIESFLSLFKRPVEYSTLALRMKFSPTHLYQTSVSNGRHSPVE